MLTRREKIRWLCLVIGIGTPLCAVYHLVAATFFHATYPNNTFLFRPWDRFHDFTSIVDLARDLNPYRRDFGGSYLPFAYILATPFGVLGQKFGELIFCGVFTIFALLYIYRCGGFASDTQTKWWMKAAQVVIIVCLSYPYLVELDRGNFEAYLFVFAAGAIWLAAFPRASRLAPIALGLAIAMKGYPALYLADWIARRKFAATAAALAIATGVSFASLAAFQGGALANFLAMRADMQIAVQKLAVDSSTQGGVGFSQSLYNAVVTVSATLLNIMPTRAGSANFLHSYNLFASAATLAVAAYAILAEKLPWRRMLLITLAILVFPCISGNYKELLLFIPLAAFLDAPEGTSRDKLVCAVIGFLMIPKNYVMLYGDVSIAVVLDPLACLLLLYVTIRDRFLARPTVSEPREAGAAGT